MMRAKSYFHRIRRWFLSEKSATYWTRYNVTLHRAFRTAEESLAYFQWRNDQYIDYIKHMPVSGLDEKVILDYGCGPGNDLVGFGLFSKPSQLIGVDVSPTSIEEAQKRLTLHKISAKLILITENSKRLPFDDASIDYIHSSGVIHHIGDPKAVLSEFKRILKPDGEVRIMVYNYNSVFLHLNVAFLLRIRRGLYADLPIRDAFGRFTDGEECPVAHVYKSDEFIDICRQAGLQCTYLGAAISVKEMDDLGMRWQAIMNPALEEEHRQFLSRLRFDERGIPMHDGSVAGHDACYSLRKNDE
jgi:SAM-dependent methyltransferase